MLSEKFVLDNSQAKLYCKKIPRSRITKISLWLFLAKINTGSVEISIPKMNGSGGPFQTRACFDRWAPKS